MSARTSRGRGLRACAALALAFGASAQGCVGLVLELPSTDNRDLAEVTDELRTLRAGLDAAPSAAHASLPRPPRHDERLTTVRDDERTVHAYRRAGGGTCVHLIVFLPLPTPGCDEVDVYAMRDTTLVEARERRSAAYGIVCSPLAWILPRSFDACFELWGD